MRALDNSHIVKSLNNNDEIQSVPRLSSSKIRTDKNQKDYYYDPAPQQNIQQDQENSDNNIDFDESMDQEDREYYQQLQKQAKKAPALPTLVNFDYSLCKFCKPDQKQKKIDDLFGICKSDDASKVAHQDCNSYCAFFFHKDPNFIEKEKCYQTPKNNDNLCAQNCVVRQHRNEAKKDSTGAVIKPESIDQLCQYRKKEDPNFLFKNKVCDRCEHKNLLEKEPGQEKWTCINKKK